jgi:hypothetical protein
MFEDGEEQVILRAKIVVEAIQTARNKALEEAAKMAEDEFYDCPDCGVHTEIAAAIRALKME